MPYLGLFFVGSVYFINGLTLLGRIDARSAAPMNLMIGSLLLAVAGYNLLPLQKLDDVQALGVVFSSVGVVLFAFTFLYVGIGSYTNDSGKGFGWYCAWSCAVSIGLALMNVLRFDDLRSAILWSTWAVVFAAFYALNVLRIARLTAPVGWFTIVAGFTTCFYPGALQILGLWGQTPVSHIGTLCLLTVGLLFFMALRSRKQAAQVG